MSSIAPQSETVLKLIHALEEAEMSAHAWAKEFGEDPPEMRVTINCGRTKAIFSEHGDAGQLARDLREAINAGG